MNNVLTYENFTQAEPVMYTEILKEWRYQKGNRYSYDAWQRSVLNDYADLVIAMSNRKLDKKEYLSLEERADFMHCYKMLNFYRFHLPDYEKMRIAETHYQINKKA